MVIRSGSDPAKPDAMPVRSAGQPVFPGPHIGDEVLCTRNVLIEQEENKKASDLFFQSFFHRFGKLLERERLGQEVELFVLGKVAGKFLFRIA